MKFKPPKIKRRPTDKRQARDFARTAEAGRTYYYVATLAGGPDDGTDVVVEFQFTKKAIIGLAWGGHSPEGMWLQYGPLYDDRSHPDIYRLQTTVEMAEEGRKYEAQLLGSPGWAEALSQAAPGTRFRSTF